jgi:hypothetical protein
MSTKCLGTEAASTAGTTFLPISPLAADLHEEIFGFSNIPEEGENVRWTYVGAVTGSGTRQART